jgi:hypothetical protein
MIDPSQIQALTDNSKILALTLFLADHCGDRPFVDYKKLDLMEIPRLVPNIWVLDFRNGIKDGVPFHFSGTTLDTHFGRNITGLKVGEHYSGQDYKRVVEELYFNVYTQKKIAFAKRRVHFSDDFIDRINVAESILFPCSGNGTEINFAIGVSEYYLEETPGEDVYVLL